MDPVIFIKLMLPDVTPLEGFSDHSTLLAEPCRFQTHVVLGFIVPSATKDPSVAGIFNAVPPKDGAWTLEIALELPELLPSIDGNAESLVTTRDGNCIERVLCLSNRMSRFHYQDNNIPWHLLLPRTEAWHGEIQVGGSEGAMLTATEEQLRTVAAMQFEVTGETTEQAFEGSIANCLETLFASVNAVLQAIRECHPGFAPNTRSVHRDNVSFVYVLMSGDNATQGAKLALDGGQVSLNPTRLDGDSATRFRAIADGSTELSDVDRLIGEAESSWQQGEYEFAFLQTVIAAEISTMRAVFAACLRSGVNKKRLKDNRKEMTYSWALNVGLPLSYRSEVRPSDALITAMNHARSKRNDLMHEAKFSMTRIELRELLTNTREYIATLSAAGTQVA